MALAAMPPEIGAVLLEKVEFATARVLPATAIGADTRVRFRLLMVEF